MICFTFSFHCLLFPYRAFLSDTNAMADYPTQLSEKGSSTPSTPEKKTQPGNYAGPAGVEVDLPPMVMKDGIRLHPQPTSDPLDPLNWTSLKKHAILAVVMAL